MGFLGKLKFWNKDDDFSDLGLGDTGDSSSDPFASQPDSTGMQMPEQQSVPGHQDTQPGGMGGPMQQKQEYPDFNKPYIASEPTSQSVSMGDTDIYKIGKDIEVVSSKLDALRASLDSINQRLANLERIAEGDNKKKGW